MIRTTKIRDATNVNRNAVDVSRPKCRVGFGGKTEECEMDSGVISCLPELTNKRTRVLFQTIWLRVETMSLRACSILTLVDHSYPGRPVQAAP